MGQARELRRDKDYGQGGGAQQCCMHHGNPNIEGASRGANDAQEEDKGNNANSACERCQREPMHNGRDRGGGATQQEMTEDDDG